MCRILLDSSPLRSVATVLAIALVLALGCDSTADSDDMAFEFTFEENSEGWEGSVTDFETSLTEADIQFHFERREVPGVDAQGRMGLLISSLNLSDDVFMFVKRYVSGLRANTSYAIRYDIALGTNAPSGCVGAGGAPGESVYLKVGAAPVEPLSVVQNDHHRLNVDKGNQAQGGANAVVAGNVANGIEDCSSTEYRLVPRDNRDNLVVQSSDASGGIWLFAGTDSGFEGTTAVYFDAILVRLTAQ